MELKSDDLVFYDHAEPKEYVARHVLHIKKSIA
jgi:hypothetical protein